MPDTQVYYALSEATMQHDVLLSRLNQWWGPRMHEDPWAAYRVQLLRRAVPYYTFAELEALAQLLLVQEERTVLLQKSISSQQEIRMSEYACRLFEQTALALARMRYQFTFGPMSRTFVWFPGSSRGKPPYPQGQVSLNFSYDLRIFDLEGSTYYVCPGDQIALKINATPSGPLEAQVIRGEERRRLLALAEKQTPFILCGTPYEVRREQPGSGEAP